jgi:hypothetical protein
MCVCARARERERNNRIKLNLCPGISGYRDCFPSSGRNHVRNLTYLFILITPLVSLFINFHSERPNSMKLNTIKFAQLYFVSLHYKIRLREIPRHRVRAKIAKLGARLVRNLVA